jgi:hypothetical protein
VRIGWLLLSSCRVDVHSRSDCLFLLASLTVGTVANVLTVALPRDSAAHGIPFKPVEVITDENKVMTALQMLEQKYEGCGEPLLKEFFSAGLSDKELSSFTNLQDSRKRAAKASEKVRKQAAFKGYSKRSSSRIVIELTASNPWVVAIRSPWWSVVSCS